MSSIAPLIAPLKRPAAHAGMQMQPSPVYRSPIAISPCSSDSPPDSAASPPDTTRRIVTLKEWVLPPRPKPGRKPCLDTPASKRKAQNRAAQRAFRERRATRVQELEEQLAQVEKENSTRESQLTDTINRLKKENDALQKGMDLLKLEMLAIRLMLLVGQADHSASASSFLHSYMSSNPALASFQASMLSASSTQQLSPESSEYGVSPSVIRKASFDCGSCAKDDCTCAQVGLKVESPRTKRRHGSSSFKGITDTSALTDSDLLQIKPMPAVPLARKRKHSDTAESAIDDGIIDFTKLFVLVTKPKPMPTFKRASVDSQSLNSTSNAVAFDECSPVENCGFCSDDTPCVCREAAQEAARLNVTLQDLAADERDRAQSKTLPPIKLDASAQRKSSLPVLHPGPSVEIRDISNLSPGPSSNVKGPSQPMTPQLADSDSKPIGCTGNPGQCTQCQSDPLSTLFCTTVASRATESAVRPSISSTDLRASLSSMLNMPGDSTAQSPAPTGPSNVPATSPGIFINCADAYKTLSRHEKFKLADFSSLVGKLTTRGMQVEVQSVANVLRELDRRFYH